MGRFEASSHCGSELYAARVDVSVTEGRASLSLVDLPLPCSPTSEYSGEKGNGSVGKLERSSETPLVGLEHKKRKQDAVEIGVQNRCSVLRSPRISHKEKVENKQIRSPIGE